MVSIGQVKGTILLDDQFSGPWTRAQQLLGESGKKFQALGTQASTFGRALLPVSAAVGAMGIGAMKAATNFESSFAGVRKTVDATEEEFTQLSAGFRTMAREIPISVNELNRIGEAAGQLGIKTENILGFSRTMADLGVTTNLSSDQAATALARLANITGMPQTEFDRLGSTIVALGNNLATTEAEIVAFGLRIAGAGEIAGLTEAQILSIGAAMSSVGIEAEAGGTAVQKVLIEMTDAVSRGGEELNIFAATAGMSSQQFATAFREDAGAAFAAFVAGIGSQGIQATQTLEALELQDQRLIKAFLSLGGAGDLLTRSLHLGTEAWRENTALATEAEQRYRTTSSQLTKPWNNVYDLGITMGEALIPALKLGIEKVREWLPVLESAVTWFTELPAPVKMAAVVFGAVVAAAGPLLIAFGSLISLAGLTVTALGTLAGVAGLAGTTTAMKTAATQATTTATTITSVGTASKASGLLVGGFTAVLAGIVVPLAMHQVVRLFEQIRGYLQDAAGWKQDAMAETAVHLRAMAEASRVAGREITSAAEAQAILRAEALRLQEVHRRGVDAMQGGVVAFNAQVTAAHDLTVTTDGLRVTVEAGNAALRKVPEATGAAAGGLRILTEEQKKAAEEARKAALDRAYLNAMGELEMTADAAALALDGYLATLQQLPAAYEDILPPQAMFFDHLNMNLRSMLGASQAQEGFLGAMREIRQQVPDAIIPPPSHSGWSRAMGGLKGWLTGSEGLGSLNSIFQAAFTGGGGALGAVKSFATQTVASLTGMIPVVGPIISQFSGAIVAGLSKLGGLFGIGKSEGRKQLEEANAHIKKLQDELLRTHGSIENIIAVGGAAGQALADAWGSQNQEGLRWFTQLVGEFQDALGESEQAAKTLEEESRLATQLAQGSFTGLTGTVNVLQAKLRNTESLTILSSEFAKASLGATYDLNAILREAEAMTESLGTSHPAIQTMQALIAQAAATGVWDFAALGAAIEAMKKEMATPIIIPVEVKWPDGSAFTMPGGGGDQSGPGGVSAFKPPSADDIRDFVRRNPGDTTPERIRSAFTNITDEVANAAGVFSYAGGSAGLQDFGRTGTWARLHDEEEVLTRQQGEGVATMVARALRGGASQPTVIHVHTHLDGREAAETVVRHMPRVLSLHGVA